MKTNEESARAAPHGGDQQLLRELPDNFLRAALGKHVGMPVPEGLVTTSYQLYRDRATGLEYAVPPVPGNGQFYSWLSSFPWYYPRVRWEYGSVAQLAQNLAKERGRIGIVDVGCGSGEFLSTLQGHPGYRCLGIEPTASAARRCAELGVECFCGETSTFMANPNHERFDIVCSFHTLEHVPNPHAFVRELVSLARPGGVICISTPLSPMFFEAVWFDALNHPPHHLSRWTIAAYSDLARKLGVSIEFRFPKSIGVLRQIWFCAALVNFGPARRVSVSRRLLAIARHPLRILRISAVLLTQRASHPHTRWESVLVVLRT
jgi:SAM-dependent methyltransferase